MPEPTSIDHAQRYIALKQNVFESSVGSEVPMEKSDRQTDMQDEEQKTGPIVRQTMVTTQSINPTTPNASYSSSMPPPPVPIFGTYGNRTEWPMRSTMGHARPPLPPTYHLHAPRPQYEAGSRMRGDGFLLDAEDEPDGLDLSNSSESDPLPMQLNRSATSGIEDQERLFGMASMMDSERPRSAGPSYASGVCTMPMSRTSTGDSAASVLVCPSCGEQPTGADAESSFHAHVSRCFISAVHTASPGRRSAAPSSNGDSGGPIRKTRSRAASAAASTGNAAELASALANTQSPTSTNTTPEHGYHPYGNGTLNSTLRQLRRTVDQLDLHQRISIMEAFHRLSRAAMTEHAQALTPKGKNKLRSATNSPSPKHKPMEDKVCSNIMSLLYSPRLTAPHPSPSFAMSGLHLGVPSPLRIGVSHSEATSAPMDTNPGDSSLRSLMSSPVSGMDTLELGAVHTPVRKSYLFANPLSPDPVASPIDEVFSPNSIMVTDPDGSESEAAGSSLALTGAFAGAMSSASGTSSPASSTPSAPSEQTSPSAPTENSSYSVDRSSDRFPAHCFPDSATRSEVRSPENTTLHLTQQSHCNDDAMKVDSHRAQEVRA